MNCRQCQERLQDFLDETLEAAERAEVGAHIASCEACRGELEALRKVASLVGSLDELPAPEGFLQGVRARIERPSAWERVRRFMTQPVRPGYSVAIPVIIVAFLAVFAVMMSLPPKTTKEVSEVETARPEKPKDSWFRWDEPSAPSEERLRLRRNHELEGTEHGTPESGRRHDLYKKESLEVTNGTYEEAERGRLRSRAGGDMDEDRLADDAAGAGETLLYEREAGGKAAEANAKSESEGLTPYLGGKKTEGEEVIQLIVLDLPRDQANVEKIAVEEGGQLTVLRTKTNNVNGLLVEVPGANYDRAVNRLQFYNDSNKLTQQVQLEEDAEKEPQSKAAPVRKAQPEQQKPLPLIIRRLVKQLPVAGTETKDAE